MDQEICDRNLVLENELTVNHDDGGTTLGLEIAEIRLFHRDGTICDNCPEVSDEEEVESEGGNAALLAAKARHAERGAAERRFLIGMSTQEPGSAIVSRRGKTVQGLEWRNGELVDRPWSEHPAFQESVRRQNAFQKAEEAFHAHQVGVGFDKAGYDPPAPDAPGFLAVTPVTSVAATSKRRHLSKADLEAKRKLLVLATSIRVAVERDDRAAAGAKLCEAKALLGHGPFVAWIEAETGLSVRSAQRFMEAASG
jgi:hypothetical protein